MIGEIGADVIALQEADKRFGDRAGLLDLAALARDAGLVPVRVRTATAATAGTATSCSCARALVRGLHQIRLPGLEPRGALVVDLDLATGRCGWLRAHLGLLRQSRLLQVEALLQQARESTGAAGGADGRPQRMAPAGPLALVRFQAVFGPLGRGVPSFPAFFPVLALDRVCCRAGIIEESTAHDTPLSRLASDHLPVKAVIRLGAAGATAEGGSIPVPAAARVRRAPRRLLDAAPDPNRDEVRPEPFDDLQPASVASASSVAPAPPSRPGRPCRSAARDANRDGVVT